MIGSFIASIASNLVAGDIQGAGRRARPCEARRLEDGETVRGKLHGFYPDGWGGGLVAMIEQEDGAAVKCAAETLCFLDRERKGRNEE